MTRTTTRVAKSKQNPKPEGGEQESDSPEVERSEGKVLLKLVGAESYHCHVIKSDTIVKGELVEVDAALADSLLEETYLDALNNEHPYFIETTAEEEAASAKRAARRSAKAVPDEDEAE